MSGGFDAFFRLTFDRTDRPNHIWGPPGTAAILHHRFRGFQWNLTAGAKAVWHVHDIFPDVVRTTRFQLADGFAAATLAGERTREGPILTGPGFAVESVLMDHGTPSAAYIVREMSRVNVDPARLTALGLTPGSWLKRVRGLAAAPGEQVSVNGQNFSLAVLQTDLLLSTSGDSVAYLTDFRMDAAARERLVGVLAGVGTVVCESQYQHADADLAARNMHMTAVEAATLAVAAGVGRRVLFHLSDRYDAEGWQGILDEARAVFPATTFPDHWAMGK